MKQLYKVKVSAGLEYESIADQEQGIQVGQQVIIRCEKYLDFAEVVSLVGDPIEDMAAFERQRAQQNRGRHVEGQGIPVIVRIASETDCQQAAENDRQAFHAHNQTMDRIRAHHLEMKLIHTHYAFDHKLVIFQFSADGRIDFRELLRDLTGLLKVRVELRQVGVRDEASILGGVGTCGRPFCCASFLPSFNSINVKMAKQQGLSLNPQNISGCCGRLKCCLQYEADAYREMNAELKAKQQSCSGCSVCDGEESSGDAAVPVESEDFFEGDGTIVTAQQHYVAAAADGTTGNMQGITRQQHQEHRRERQQNGQGGGGGRQNRDGKEQGGGNGQRRNRPQQNPQKKPLPSLNGGEDGENGEKTAARQGSFGPQGGGNRNRGGDGQRGKDRGERNRGQGQHGGSRGENRGSRQQEGQSGGDFGKAGKGENPSERRQPSIGEFGE